MTLGDLIRRFRALSNDRVEPFLWSDGDVTDWLNDAQDQACVRGRLLREEFMPAMCRIPLSAARRAYKMHPAAYEIIHLRILPFNGDRARDVELKSREWLDAECPGWRDGDRPACMAIQDDKSLRLVGKIEDGDVLAMECYRLALNMESDDDEPEIHSAHHEHLIQWALYRAFGVPDAEGFDPNRSMLAEREFTAYFGPLPNADLRRSTRHDVVHHTRLYLA